MPLSVKARIEVYLPDLPKTVYQELLQIFTAEFTTAFGGCTIVRGLDGNYLSKFGQIIPDRINLIYTDLPLALSTNFESVARYADELKQAAVEALSEEAILVAVTQVYHAV